MGFAFLQNSESLVPLPPLGLEISSLQMHPALSYRFKRAKMNGLRNEDGQGCQVYSVLCSVQSATLGNCIQGEASPSCR